MRKKQNSITDEAVISFASDLIKEPDKTIYYHLSNRGIEENEILNSNEVNSDEKISLLKHIRSIANDN